MAEAKRKLGIIACGNVKCRRDVYVRSNDKGTLSLSCDHCGFAAFARSGTEYHADVTSTMQPIKRDDPAPSPAPAPKPSPAPAPAPAPKGRLGIYG